MVNIEHEEKHVFLHRVEIRTQLPSQFPPSVTLPERWRYIQKALQRALSKHATTKVEWERTLKHESVDSSEQFLLSVVVQWTVSEVQEREAITKARNVSDVLGREIRLVPQNKTVLYQAGLPIRPYYLNHGHSVNFEALSERLEQLSVEIQRGSLKPLDLPVMVWRNLRRHHLIDQNNDLHPELIGFLRSITNSETFKLKILPKGIGEKSAIILWQALNEYCTRLS